MKISAVPHASLMPFLTNTFSIFCLFVLIMIKMTHTVYLIFVPGTTGSVGVEIQAGVKKS